MPEEQAIDDSQAHSMIRGNASEHIITTLANIGAAQVSIEMDGL
jgi:glutamine phosphoribosylpyrophosphate amidotransferase